MWKRVLCGAVLATFAVVPWTVAADKKNKVKVPITTGVETKNVGPTIPSKTVAQKVARLTDQIDWHFTLDDVRSQAQQENKAILWLHVLGDLDRDC